MNKLLTISALAVAALTLSAPQTANATWGSYRVMIDPGHGGSDPGALGPSAPHEAELALRCANAAGSKLSGVGCPYRLTRTSNVDVSLTSRRSQSVSYDPYVFNSIHLNAFNGTATGTETWYYWDGGNSHNLANYVQSNLVALLGRANRGVKQNGWTVITGSSNVPAVLSEGLFVDNNTEWSMINNNNNAGFQNWVKGHVMAWYKFGNEVQGMGLEKDPYGAVAPTVSLSVSPSSWTFNCVKGASASGSFTVTAQNLSSAIAVTTSNSKFAISASSIAKTGGKLTVTYKPTGIGSETATITLKSGDKSATIKCTGNCTPPPLTMSEKWNMSVTGNSKVKNDWDATKVRNMCYANGKLYMTYDNKVVKVVKAMTTAAGSVLGDLNNCDVVAGGIYPVCDVRAFDGKIFACNLASTANDNSLRIYRWDTDASKPVCVLDTKNWGGATRIGDCMSFVGNLSNGQVTFANDDGTTTRVINYKITNGTFSATPTVTNVTTDGATQIKTAASTRAIYDAVGGNFWIDGKDNYPTYCNNAGKQQWRMNSDGTWGNGIATFTYETIPYAVVTQYNPKSDNAAENYLGGRGRVVNCKDGYGEPTDVCDLPTNGFSNSADYRNTNCVSNVIPVVTGNCVQIWVQIMQEGIGYYTNGGTEPSFSYSTIPVINDEPTISVTQGSNPVASLSMNTVVNTTKQATITVKGSKLTGAVALALSGTNASYFSLSKSSVAQSGGNANDNVVITYAPKTEGNHTATLTLTSAGAAAVKVTLKGTSTPQVTYASEIDGDKFEKVWLFSVNNGNLASASWFGNDASKSMARSLAVIGGNLYVLNGKSWGEYSLVQLDAYSGNKKADISLDGVTGGTTAISCIRAMGNDLVGCNRANGTSHNLKVYKWTNGAGTPTAILDIASSTLGFDAGGEMGVYGNLNNGKISFSDGKKVAYFTTSGGSVNTTPTIITLEKETGSIAATNEAVFNADGTFWLADNTTVPTLYTSDGKVSATLPAGLVSNQGSSLMCFNYASGKKYMATITTLGGSANPAWGNGAIRIINLTDGVANATAVGNPMPANGFGDSNWGSSAASTDIAVTLTDDQNSQVNVWGLVPLQGIAYYKFAGKQVNAVENIAVDAADVDEAAAEYFTLQGVRVNRANAAPGLYIRRAGKTATKVILK